MISDVARSLDAMNPPQYVLAFVFVGSYAFALGELVGTAGRRFAVTIAIVAALGFAALADPWEYGVIVLAVALAGMGLFGATAWTVWTLARWHALRPLPPEPAIAAAKPKRRLAGLLVSGWRIGIRST